MPRHGVDATKMMCRGVLQHCGDRVAGISPKVGVVRTSGTAAIPTAPSVS